jgi:hypothetical protein
MSAAHAVEQTASSEAASVEAEPELDPPLLPPLLLVPPPLLLPPPSPPPPPPLEPLHATNDPPMPASKATIIACLIVVFTETPS